MDRAPCRRCGVEKLFLWDGDLCSACYATSPPILPPRVDTSMPASPSASAGVASMCLSNQHRICMASRCSCRCHGGEGRSAA